MEINNVEFFELIDIDSIEKSHKYNMVDLTVDEDCSFMLENGIISHNSAMGSGIRVRNVNTTGFFPLRGLPMNSYGESESAVLANKELNNIMSILDLKFPEYYSITLDNGEEIVASINDEVFIDGKWKQVKDLIKS